MCSWEQLRAGPCLLAALQWSENELVVGVATPGECDAGGVELNLLSQLREQEERGSLPALPALVRAPAGMVSWAGWGFWLEVQGADQGCAPFDPVLLWLVRRDLHSNHVVGGVACCRQRACNGGRKDTRVVLQPRLLPPDQGVLYR